MTKILISPIGTGRLKSDDKGSREYDVVEYSFDGGKTRRKSPFIFSVIADEFQIDKLILVGTGKSMWEEVYRYFAKDKIDEDYWIELGELASTSNHETNKIRDKDIEILEKTIDDYFKNINPASEGGSKIKLIKYGLNQGEIWENFDKIMKISDLIDEGDETHIDITHSFRSIPLFIYLLLDFISILKKGNVKIAGIYYGMLEAMGELGYASVVNLGPIFKISELIRGTYDFINYGNGYLISDVLYKENNIGKETNKKINNISDLININYLVDLEIQIKSLEKELEKEEKIGMLKYISPIIEEFLNRFINIEKSSEFQLELSRWYYENNRIGYAYICLSEAILTRLCEVYMGDEGLGDIGNRRYMGHLLWKHTFGRQSSIIGGPKERGLASRYDAISKIRNRIAHASFYDDKFSFRSDFDNFENSFIDVERIIKSKEIEKLPEEIPLDIIKNSFNKKY